MLSELKKHITRRSISDTGNSNTIEMIFVLLIFFAVMMTVIDTGIYFNNRYVISNAAQNGARLAAIFGGTGKTTVAKEYGITEVHSKCSAFGLDNAVECSVYDELSLNSNTVNTTINSINCTPDKTTKIGERTACEIRYTYHGLPGSGLSMTQMFGDNLVRMTAESEVVNK